MESTHSTQRQVVAGVLSKYVNIAKGWKDRLFILSDDRLRYYKLSGKKAVNVQRVLEHHDPEGSHTQLIGAQVFVLQKDHGKRAAAVSASKPVEPAGVYELQRAKLRESGTESHKFYIHTPGKPTVTVKTETPDDRYAWVAAMSATKVDSSSLGSSYPAVNTALLRGHSGAIPDGSAPASQQRFQATLDELQRTGTLPPAAAATLQAEFAAVQKESSAKTEQLRQREVQIKQLMEERRQLQTKMVTADVDGDAPVPALDGEDDHDDEADDDNDSVAASVLSLADNNRTDFDGDAFYDATDGVSSSLSSTQISTGKPAAATNGARAAAGAASPTPLAVPTSSAVTEPDWLKSASPISRREKLPEPAETQKSVSLWGIIKECIGKDLTRICLPVYFNEPLSALQKMTEEFQYASLLEKAAKQPKGSVERLMSVAVFALSGYAGSGSRTCKPFNPLLGETYEHVDISRRFRFLAEKVVHHPTILAAFCEGAGWEVAADLEVKSKFWGRCIELKPIGRIQIKFHDGETIIWNKVTSTINNLILGKIYVEHSGTMRVQSDAVKTEVRIKFKDSGSMFGGSKHVISGRVFDGNRELQTHKLEGTWEGPVTLDTGNGPSKVWEAAPVAAHPTRYGLTQFAIELNEVTPGLEAKLPPTDCRLRPDQAALESGRFDQANLEKQRLEKKQRRARKEAEEGKPIDSRWFLPIEGAKRGEELSYVFSGDYWQQRAAGTYTGCRDIFGQDEPGLATSP